MIKLVIFDFDGLIVNSEEVVFMAIRDIFKEYGHNYTWEYFSQHIGRSVDESLQIFYNDFPIPIPFEEFYQMRNKKVAESIEKQLKIMDGLLPLLQDIGSLDISMAIATSGKKEYVMHYLKKFDIDKYFPTVVTIDDVQKGKPHPDLILKVLEQTHVDAVDAIMIEDAPHGIEASYNAHVFSIAVPTKGMDYNLFTKANCIVEDLSQILQLLTLLH